MSLFSLPAETLSHIFEYLPLQDVRPFLFYRNSYEIAKTRLYEVLCVDDEKYSFPLFAQDVIVLTFNEFIEVYRLINPRYTKRISLRCRFNDIDTYQHMFEIMSSYTNSRNVIVFSANLDSLQMSDISETQLRPFKHIDWLCFNKGHLCNRELIHNVPSLTRLTVRFGGRLHQLDLSILSSCHGQLEVLDIEYGYTQMPNDLNQLLMYDLGNLRTLNIPSFTQHLPSLVFLNSCVNLQELNLSGNKFQRDLKVDLQFLTKLTKLNISKTSYKNSYREWLSMRLPSGLKSLNLSYNNMDGRVLKRIEYPEGLEKLYVYDEISLREDIREGTNGLGCRVYS